MSAASSTRHYATGPGFPSSTSSNSLSSTLGKDTMESSSAYAGQTSSRPAQSAPSRHDTPEDSHRGTSMDSLSFAQLSLDDGRQRRPSQPASSFTSPGNGLSEIRRPDSRSQHTASPYSHHGTPAPSNSDFHQQSFHQQAHPAYAQRLSYEQAPDRPASHSDMAYVDPSQPHQHQQPYGSQYRHSDPSAYGASTSQQPYGGQYAPNQSDYGSAYGGEPSQLQDAYYPHQGQEQYSQQGQYFDPSADYYDPTQSIPQGYDQYSQGPGPSNQMHGATMPQQQQYGAAYAAGSQHQSFAPPQSYDMPEASRMPSGSSASYVHPALTRNKTTASTKSSASFDRDRNTQPITKQAVDDYRNRIKSDPDPETQFNFSRFLIEAARRLAVAAQQGNVDDAKSVKKYRDSLLQEAIKLVKRLATQGSGLGKPAYADAQFFLANCLGHGALGLSVDHEKAYNLYVQASKQNHPAATYRTAVCNEVGAGTRRDANRAVLFYRKASALGDTAGMYKLGMILLNGLLGQQKNPRESVIWLKKAAAQADEENPHALHELGLLYEKPVEFSQNGQPIPAPVMRDEAQARELFTQAAQFGHPPSQYKLGACYEYGSLTCPVDPRRSIAWYTRAAEKGHAESELALSGWYLTGSPDVLKQSDSEAYLWARRAANKGLSKAEYAVGYYAEIGIGVKAELDEAKMWYLRAAASGNRRAMQRLSELKKLGNRKAQQGARPTRQQAEKECVIM